MTRARSGAAAAQTTDTLPLPAQQSPDADKVKCGATHAGWRVRCTRNDHPPDEEHEGGAGLKWMEGAPGSRGGDSPPAAEKPAAAPAQQHQAQPVVAAAPAASDQPAAQQPVAVPPAAQAIPAAAPRAQPAQQPARAAAQQPAAVRPVGRMVLPSARTAQPTDDKPGPWKMFLYGLPKIGKTSFGVDADKPIFIPIEKSPNVPEEMQFPKPATWQDVLDAITVLGTTDHPYKTVVLDTADAAEPLLIELIKKKAAAGAGAGKGAVNYLADVGGGYNKGNDAMVEEWTPVLSRLERLQQVKGMNVIIIAHGKSEKYSNPDGADFDMWMPKVDKKVAGLLIGWADIVGFANVEITTTKDGKRGRAKGGTTGAHWLNVDRSAATFWAGNRHNLPARLPLDYSAFAAALEAGAKADVTELVAGIKAKATMLEGHTFLDRTQREVRYTEWVAQLLTRQPPPRRGELLKIDSRLAAKLQELEQPADDDTTE